MIPFFIYYSMFGFQRIGDLVWAACDARTKGFMLGATAGRTTLNGEGLQHQDGHSHLIASAFPTVRCYDPAYAYETTMIILDGMQKMYVDNEPLIYYITLENEGYVQPPLPESAEIREGILRGMYRLNSVETDKDAPRVQLLGSGALIRSALEAQRHLGGQLRSGQRCMERDELPSAPPRSR